MLKDTNSTLDLLKARMRQRDVYLWGARQDGLSMCKVLERQGYRPVGFIDSSLSLQGKTVLNYPVFPPDALLSTAGSAKPYIIITSAFYADEIAHRCAQAGLTTPDDFITHSEIQCFDYQIDISGVCNLKCISCPRGNFSPQPAAGFMDAGTYEKVLRKIISEDPFVGAVSLYNWGEPLLNPHLPEMITFSNELGVHTALSSNLSLQMDFTDVVRSRPTWFRVSVSGFGSNYEITHTGGRWELFLANLYRLRELMDQYHPELQVEVFYHIYRNNNGEDFHKMKKLCEELGFTLRFRHAALAPLENVEAVIEGRPLSAGAMRTRELQILSVEEAMALAVAQKDRPCFYERCLWITWDLKVSQCMEWFTPGLTLVPGDFLHTPLSEIAAARRDNDFCRRCKERAIHRCYMVYGDEKLVHERRSVTL
ncbi:MAG: radical SAM protein [Deltaproteobacteria bacterium]|nr:radical SAM protein [Deltaproteobacteria bacterium]